MRVWVEQMVWEVVVGEGDWMWMQLVSDGSEANGVGRDVEDIKCRIKDMR